MSEIMSEAKLQSDCYLWFHQQYPEYRGLLCYNLNNSRSKIQAMTDRSLGLQPGRSDLVLYYKSIAYMLEAKTQTGKQEPNQKVWQAKIVNAGFTYQIFRSKEEFICLILSIIK
jgi:hypothetical protein